MRKRSSNSRQQIWDRLLTDRKEKEIMLEQIKEQKTQSEFEGNCSFQPEINLNSELITYLRKKNGLDTHNKLDDKLYEDAFDRLQKKEKLKQLKDEQDYKHLTFTPEINTKQSLQNMHTHFSKDDRPIYERYKEV
jgi:hypothetical protein